MNLQCALRRSSRNKLGMILVLLVLQCAALHGQQKKPAKSNEELAKELNNDKRYPFEDLLQAKPGAVANAKKIYALTSDPELKQRLASILISIGVKDQIYREYLERAARKALADETPWPTQFNEKNEKSWDPVFLEWCKKKELNPVTILEKAYYEIPNPWYFLAASGDPAFYDLFIEGLHSHNRMIAGTAAQGLAKLQDVRAIEPLIAAGRQSLAEARFGIGESLLYFSDPKAQAAAEEFINTTDKTLLETLRRESKEKGVKGLFQW
jgi:HEAT repeat protein